MRRLRERIKEKFENHVKDRKDLLKAKVNYKIETLKDDLRKKFTIASLLIVGVLLIFQGIVRFFPIVFNIPEYFGFFLFGGALVILGLIYYFRSRKKDEIFGF